MKTNIPGILTCCGGVYYHTYVCPQHGLRGSASQQQTSPWKTTEPPHDGTTIVAIGHLVYESAVDDIRDEFDEVPQATSTCSEPFLAKLRWTEKPGESAGWHHEHGLSLARTLTDKVHIDYWLEAPQ